MPEPAALRAEWEDVLSRRPSFRPALAFYEPILDAWERFDPAGISPLACSPGECRERWQRGVAILAEAPLALDREPLDPLLEAVLGALAGVGEEAAEAAGRVAQAWEEGRLRPDLLLSGLASGLSSPAARPEPLGSNIHSGLASRLSSPLAPPESSGSNLHTGAGDKAAQANLLEELALSPDLLAFVAYFVLRPPLAAYLSATRQAFKDEYWDYGHCPLCGASPTWGDIREDGKRWLCCARCGGEWTIGRIRCPFCDNRNARTLTRLSAEGAEEGYLIEVCDLCRGYLKGVDRRLRWNVVSPLVEDWGTPHLDLIAHRRGYWRAGPSVVQLAEPQER